MQRATRLLGLACWAFGILSARGQGYDCRSELFLDSITMPERKGIAVDDTTHANCSAKMLESWPHTGLQYVEAAKVTSLRIFKPWNHEWPAHLRAPAWDHLLAYVRAHNVKVLLGTSIGCSEEYDQQSWQWTKELLHLLGLEHIMGLAVGDELEMFHRFTEELNVDAQCLEKLFDGGYANSWFRKVVRDFDAMGFGAVPITSVFGGLALAGNTTPFYNIPEARVNDFLSKVVNDYRQRFVFTFNFYPYFDPNLKLDNETNETSTTTAPTEAAMGSDVGCTKALASSLCWDWDCNLPATTAAARRKMTELTGDPSWRMWLGEVGWSSPYSPSLGSSMKACPAWSSPEAYQSFYKGFLSWDLSISNVTNPLIPPEHVFWFTMRDSYVFGVPEYFGLVSGCDDDYCKMTEALDDPVPEEMLGQGQFFHLDMVNPPPGRLAATWNYLGQLQQAGMSPPPMYAREEGKLRTFVSGQVSQEEANELKMTLTWVLVPVALILCLAVFYLMYESLRPSKDAAAKLQLRYLRTAFRERLPCEQDEEMSTRGAPRTERRAATMPAALIEETEEEESDEDADPTIVAWMKRSMTRLFSEPCVPADGDEAHEFLAEDQVRPTVTAPAVYHAVPQQPAQGSGVHLRGVL